MISSKDIFPLCAGDQLIAVINIGLVMQIMVEFQCFLAHTSSGQRIIHKTGQAVQSHLFVSLHL